MILKRRCSEMTDCYIDITSTAVALVSDFAADNDNIEGLDFVQIYCVEKNDDRMTINITALNGYHMMVVQEENCEYCGDIEFPLFIKITPDIYKFLKAPKKTAHSAIARFYIKKNSKNECSIESISVDNGTKSMSVPERTVYSFPDINAIIEKADETYNGTRGCTMQYPKGYFSVPFSSYAKYDLSKYFGGKCVPTFLMVDGSTIVHYQNYTETTFIPDLHFLGIVMQNTFGENVQNYKLPVHKFSPKYERLYK